MTHKSIKIALKILLFDNKNKYYFTKSKYFSNLRLMTKNSSNITNEVVTRKFFKGVTHAVMIIRDIIFILLLITRFPVKIDFISLIKKIGIISSRSSSKGDNNYSSNRRSISSISRR
jgi:hypothetical protein